MNRATRAWRPGYRRRAAFVRLTLIAVALAVLQLGSAPAFASPQIVDRPALMFGDNPQPLIGATGTTSPLAASCYLLGGQAQMKMSPPQGMTPSYDTRERGPQAVWWQPRVWWLTSTGESGVTKWGEFGWHFQWARSADEFWRLSPLPVPLPGVGMGPAGIVGGVTAPWNDEQGNPHPWDWSAISTLAPGYTYMVENVYYWEANDWQPQDGWDGEKVSMLVGDYSRDLYPSCVVN